LLDPSMCRRASLLKAMGCDPVDCAGCDVCDGTVSAFPPEIAELTGFIARNRALIQRPDFAAELKRYGRMKQFSHNQIRQLLHDCLDSGLARYSRSPLSWKRLIT